MTGNHTLTNKVYGTSTNVLRSITGWWTNALVGKTLMKFGAGYGYEIGEVKAVDVSILFPDEIWTHGLTEVKNTDGRSGPGDSGGPWYGLYRNSEYDLYGIHCGSNGAGTTAFFTPCWLFLDYFTPRLN